MVQAWDREVSTRDLGVSMTIRNGGEVLDQHNLCSLKSIILNRSLNYLSKGPVSLHGPEGDSVHVVH